MTYEELRAIPLKFYILSEDDKGKRLAVLRRGYLNVALLLLLITVTAPLVSIGRHRPFDGRDDFIIPAVMALASLGLYFWCPKKFTKPLVDSLAVEVNGLKKANNISEKSIAFKKISDVSTCAEGLWVEHGWTYTILENKYFESYTDMLKFKDVLLEVARASRRK